MFVRAQWQRGAAVGAVLLSLLLGAFGSWAQGPADSQSRAERYAGAPRTWTDATGRYTVPAELVEVADGRVTLRRTDNGKEVSLPVTGLSKEDQNHLQHAANRVDPEADLLIGRIVRVVDGDTIEVWDQRTGKQTVRLEGIDAPENGQPFGEEAQEWLARQTTGRTVRIETKEKDRYGRWLGHVYLGDRWLNRDMVKAGLAWHFVNYSDDVRLAAAQSEARDASRRLWRDANRVAPWNWRDGVRIETATPPNAAPAPTPPANTTATVYVTKTGTKYHRAGCRYLSKSSIPIPLARAKAQYAPCSTCNP